jgi:hypothetical protein
MEQEKRLLLEVLERHRVGSTAWGSSQSTSRRSDRTGKWLEMTIHPRSAASG